MTTFTFALRKKKIGLSLLLLFEVNISVFLLLALSQRLFGKLSDIFNPSSRWDLRNPEVTSPLLLLIHYSLLQH